VSVGAGGEGLVYQARRTVAGDERVVALKMHTNLSFDDFEWFMARAEALSEIDHPHVMHLEDVFVGTALIDDDDPPDDAFTVMYTVANWIPGLTLPAAIEATSKSRGLGWVAQVARAAGYLHDFRSAEAPAGIVHRDIKPSNVRITPDESAVLIDFGIARPHQEGDHTEGAGTYLWRAPEVVGGPGEPGPASDAWGIGGLAYWVLTADPPRLEGAAAARELLVPAARAAGLVDAKGIGRSISRLLETHPEHRPRDLSRWADDVDRRVARKRAPYVVRVATAACALLVLAGGVAAGVDLSRVSVAPSARQSIQLAGDTQRVLPHDAQLGSLLSLASYIRSPTDQARAAMATALQQPLESVLHGGGSVTAVSYNHDGTRLVSGNSAGNVTLWNTATRTAIETVRVNGSVTGVAYDPAGALIVIGDSGGTVSVWDTADGRIRWTRDVRRKVTSVAFSPDGYSVAIADVAQGPSRQGDAIVWDPVTGAEVSKKVPSPTAPFDNSATTIAFDPTALAVVAFGASNGSIDLWRPAIGNVDQLSIPNDAKAVTSIAFSPNGKSLVAAYVGGEVGVWNMANRSPGELPRVIGTGGSVTSVAFGPDGQTVVAAYANGIIKVWRTAGAPGSAQVIGVGHRVSSVTSSPDGKTFAVGDSAGDVVLLSEAEKAVRTLDTGPHVLVDSVAFAHSGRILATGDTGGDVQLWETDDDAKIGSIVGDGSQVFSVALDAGGLHVAAGQKDDAVTVWGTLTQSRAWTSADTFANYSVAFSPDGRLLAVGNSGGQILLLDSGTGVRESAPLINPEHSGSIRSIAFGHDGRELVSGDDNGYVTVWSVATKRPVGKPILVSKSHIVRSVALSPNGRYLATGDDSGSLTLWDVDTHARIWTSRDHHRILSVAFDPDGRVLVTGDAGGNVAGWDAATGLRLSPNLDVGGQVFGLAFTSDGSTVAAAAQPTATLIPSFVVESSPAELARRLCAEVSGNLTPGQWSTYLGRTPYEDVCPTS
jgi:WD40 repeat protein